MMQKKIQSDYLTLEKELTIVIPAKNEESYIGRILEELSLQRIGNTQIILADAGSTDDTRKIATSTAFDLGLNLKIIEGAEKIFAELVNKNPQFFEKFKGEEM